MGCDDVYGETQAANVRPTVTFASGCRTTPLVSAVQRETEGA
jgi:hypothetical protein